MLCGNSSTIRARKSRSNALPSQPLPSHASAKMNPPCSMYCFSFSLCSRVNGSPSRPLRNNTGDCSKSSTVAAAMSVVCQVSSRPQRCSIRRVRFCTPPACKSQFSSSPYLPLAMTTGRRPLDRKSSANAVLNTGSFSEMLAPFQLPRVVSRCETNQAEPTRYQSCGTSVRRPSSRRTPAKNRRPDMRPTRSMPYK